MIDPRVSRYLDKIVGPNMEYEETTFEKIWDKITDVFFLASNAAIVVGVIKYIFN